MPSPSSFADRRALVAVDMGAESCRVTLLRWRCDALAMEPVHRFANGAVEHDGALRWDIDRILAGVDEGLRLCAARAPEGIRAIGVDGWAVDYVRLGPDGRPVARPYCYRDERNVAAQAAVHAILPPSELYRLTGIQILRFNTLYQLHADKLAGTEIHLPWANLPEYVLTWLGGRRVAEHTNATHTGLLTLGRPEWCSPIFAALGLSAQAAPPIVPPGSVVGSVGGALAELPAFTNTRLIAPACHDTASAIAGIPAEGDDWAFISSGTWSLVGTLLPAPCASAAAERANYTNLGAAGGKTAFLKNVNGMWLLQQCLQEWSRAGVEWTIEDLVRQARAVPQSPELIDVDDADLLQPGDMPSRINAQLLRRGLAPVSPSPSAAPRLAACILRSLAARYAAVLRDIAEITGKRLRRLYVVGGGSRNPYLNELTAQTTGLEVVRGCVESSTVGNFAIQLATLEEGSPAAGASAAGIARWARQAGRAAEG